MRIHGIVAASQFANVLIMILLCVPRAEHWTALPLELTLLARHYDRK